MSTPLPRTIRHAEWWRVLRSDPCAYCSAWPAGTVDHIDARAAGGAADADDNLTGACGRCNVAKDDTPLLLFLLAGRVRFPDDEEALPLHRPASRLPAEDADAGSRLAA